LSARGHNARSACGLYFEQRRGVRAILRTVFLATLFIYSQCSLTSIANGALAPGGPFNLQLTFFCGFSGSGQVYMICGLSYFGFFFLHFFPFDPVFLFWKNKKLKFSN
jgi:hypothetical protein